MGCTASVQQINPPQFIAAAANYNSLRYTNDNSNNTNNKRNILGRIDQVKEYQLVNKDVTIHNIPIPSQTKLKLATKQSNSAALTPHSCVNNLTSSTDNNSKPINTIHTVLNIDNNELQTFTNNNLAQANNNNVTFCITRPIHNGIVNIVHEYCNSSSPFGSFPCMASVTNPNSIIIRPRLNFSISPYQLKLQQEREAENIGSTNVARDVLLSQKSYLKHKLNNGPVRSHDWQEWHKEISPMAGKYQRRQRK